MSITEDGIFICDFCGEDTGKFNQETGNHPQCEELSALRARVEALEHLEAVAQDVNEWLKTSAGLKGSAHQQELEAALKA